MNIEEVVLDLLKDKKTCSEIAKELGLKYTFVLNIREKLLQSGRIKTKDKESFDDINSLNEIDGELRNKILHMYFNKGIPPTEIEKKLGASIRTIDKVIKEEKQRNRQDDIDLQDPRLIEAGIRRSIELGYTTQEIKEIFKIDDKQLASYARKAMKYGNIRDKKIHEARENREKRTIYRRNIIEYVLNEAEIPNPDIIREHIDYCQREFALGRIEGNDVRLLSNIIRYYPIYMSNGNINFIIKCFFKTNQSQLALQFVNECISRVKEDDPKRQTLLNAREHVKTYRKKENALRLIRLGYCSLEQISEETGVSIGEVIELKTRLDELKNKSMKTNTPNQDGEER